MRFDGVDLNHQLWFEGFIAFFHKLKIFAGWVSIFGVLPATFLVIIKAAF